MTSLVVDADAAQARTNLEETDAIGAMRRGLREYLSQVHKDIAGVRVRFEEVFEEWATSDDENVRYPSAAVLLSDGNVTFDSTGFSTSIIADDRLPDGRYVIKVAEAVTEFAIECHCSSPGERQSVSMLLEEALNPVDFMYGFALDLPHYFGQRAAFMVTAAELVDDAASARHGLRTIRAKVAGQVSVVRPRALPRMRPRFDAEVVDATSDFAVPGSPSIVSRGTL